MATDTDICNRALALAIARYTLTGTPPAFDSSAAAIACGLLYTPAWQMCIRQENPEFSRRGVTLTLVSGPAPYPYSFVYLYPADCLKVRSLVPVTWDQNNPTPIRWTVSTTNISGVPTEIIFADVPSAGLTYSSSNVTVAEWDAIFQEAVVRFLASQLTLALAGRPDLSRTLLGQAGNILQSSEDRDS